MGGSGGGPPPKGKQPAAPAADGPGAAQQRFGNAKSISSSAFHGQDSKESEYERNQRLQQFQVGGWAVLTPCWQLADASWQHHGLACWRWRLQPPLGHCPALLSTSAGL